MFEEDIGFPVMKGINLQILAETQSTILDACVEKVDPMGFYLKRKK